jgi:CHAT domain-containing protein
MSSRASILPGARGPLLRWLAVFAAILLCLAYESNAHVPAADAMLMDLRRTIGVSRLINPQLSISGGDGPCRPAAATGDSVFPGTCTATVVPSTTARRIAVLSKRATQAMQVSARPEALHTMALIDLLWADTSGKSVNRSISYLQSAARTSDRPAPILADQAAAFIVRAARTRDPRDLLNAVEAADSAVRLEPKNLAARYNLALALDLSEVAGQAEQAWDAYMAVDGKSGWGQAARERVATIRRSRDRPARPAVGAPPSALGAYASAAPQDARFWGWEELLDRWGAAVLRQADAEADRLLWTAEVLGTELERRHGDATLAQAVEAISATARGTAARSRLAAAHRHAAAAHRAYRAMRFDSMEAHARAALDVPAPSSTLRQWAWHYVGVARVLDGAWAETAALYADLLQEVDTLRSPALAGNAYAIWGTALYRSGRYQGARELYQKASRALDRTREIEQQGRAEYLLASTEFQLGMTAEAYVSAFRCLKALRGERNSTWLHSMLAVTSENAAREGLLLTAIRLQDESLAVARQTRSAYAAEALVQRVQLRVVRGDPRAGLDLREAEALIRSLPQDEIRAWLQADLQESRATSMVRGTPARAVAQLDSVIAVSGGSRTPLRLLRALVARATARLSLGDVAGATEDMDRASALVRENADSVREAPLRSLLLQNARGVFDRLAMLQVARGDTAGALRTVEQSRLSRVVAAASIPGEDGWQLPRTTVAVVYFLVGDTLLAWTAAGMDLRLTRTVVQRDTLARRIERTRSLLEARAADPVLKRHLAELYEVLVRPLEGSLARGSDLVLIPDGELMDVPFAALYDRSAGRFLVESHELRFAKSLRDVASVRTTPHTGYSVFAAPEYGRHDYPEFTALPSAAAEVRTVASLYPNARVLGGGSTRAMELRNALRSASVFHFAGHAVLDEEKPERSFLALTPDGAGDALTVSDIEKMDLRNLRLVVLSACETLRSPGGRQTGGRGLAMALMGAGTAGVVGSLGRVDDALTQSLMVEFHRAYRRTGSAPAALRHAQLQMLRSGDPDHASPAAWGTFQYTGN